MPQCDFHDAHDTATDTPAGKRCTAQATHRIEWEDLRRYSYGCDAHLEIDDTATVRPSRIIKLLTDEQRSLIASAVVAGGATHVISLCCAIDAVEACARIVGKRKATALWTWVHDSLGCRFCGDSDGGESKEQAYLDKISELEVL